MGRQIAGPKLSRSAAIEALPSSPHTCFRLDTGSIQIRRRFQDWVLLVVCLSSDFYLFIYLFVHFSAVSFCLSKCCTVVLQRWRCLSSLVGREFDQPCAAERLHLQGRLDSVPAVSFSSALNRGRIGGGFRVQGQSMRVSGDMSASSCEELEKMPGCKTR